MTATYSPGTPIFCAGCGHFGSQSALHAALGDVGARPEETIILAGIGCSGTVQNNLGTFGYHALHGRVLPTATGTALADPRLTVVAVGGDGDGYAIGAGHLVHAFRRNPPFTYVLLNNATYGLTKGQPSPTAPGVGQRPEALDGVLLGLSVTGSTFVARGFARRFEEARALIGAALEHSRAGRGFAFVEILSPCVTYQDLYPAWEAALVDVAAEPGYDQTDRAAAFAACLGAVDTGRTPVGLIYRADRPAAVADPGPAHVVLEGLTDRFRDLMADYAVSAAR